MTPVVPWYPWETVPGQDSPRHPPAASEHTDTRSCGCSSALHKGAQYLQNTHARPLLFLKYLIRHKCYENTVVVSYCLGNNDKRKKFLLVHTDYFSIFTTRKVNAVIWMPPPKFKCCNVIILRNGDFKSLLGHGDTSLMSEISCPCNKAWWREYIPFHVLPLSTLSGTKPALILDFPASRTERKQISVHYKLPDLR
jgi:hypothetical protein